MDEDILFKVLSQIAESKFGLETSVLWESVGTEFSAECLVYAEEHGLIEAKSRHGIGVRKDYADQLHLTALPVGITQKGREWLAARRSVPAGDRRYVKLSIPFALVRGWEDVVRFILGQQDLDAARVSSHEPLGRHDVFVTVQLATPAEDPDVIQRKLLRALTLYGRLPGVSAQQVSMLMKIEDGAAETGDPKLAAFAKNLRALPPDRWHVLVEAEDKGELGQAARGNAIVEAARDEVTRTITREGIDWLRDNWLAVAVALGQMAGFVVK